MTRRRGLWLALAAVAGSLTGVAPARAVGEPTCRPATDWPMFGHDLGRSFATDDNCITRGNAATLRPAWYFNAHAPVTAQPIVSGNGVYVGAYDGRFYRLNAKHGTPRWAFDSAKFDRNIAGYGRIPGSAAIMQVRGQKFVVFGAGTTVFVLNADTGKLVARQCLDRVDPSCQGKAGYTTEIESSPAVLTAGDGSTARILIGTDVNEQSPAGPAGLASLRFDGTNLTPEWFYDPEVATTYNGLPPAQDVKHLTENGCNDVWSSPTVDLATNTVSFGTGNCDHPERVGRPKGSLPLLVESTIALDATTGTFKWQYAPRAAGNGLDLDFGATPNVLRPGVVGEAGKDGTYYAYDAASGALLWKVHAAEPSEIGGAIASTALGTFSDGHRAVFMATGIPISTGHPTWSVRGAARNAGQSFGLHAIDATTHLVRWHLPIAGPSYGAVAFSRGLVFAPNTFTDTLQVLTANRGVPLRVQPMNVPPASPPAISGRFVYLGAGITETAPGLDRLAGTGGVWAFTPTALQP